MSGAFGGSAHQNAVANNENALGKQLSQYTQGMQNQQYDRSAGLTEAGLGRQMQAIPLAFQGQQLSSDLINQLNASGGQQQALGQKQLDDNVARWAEQMNWGRNNADWMANILGRAQGSTGVTSTSPGYQGTNWGSTGLGIGMLGSALMGGK
jgi:hypothetical protein